MGESAFLKLLPVGTPPKYINLVSNDERAVVGASFSDIRREFADVRLISSDKETYLCSKLFLASMSRMFYDLMQDVVPQLDDGSMLVIHTNLTSEELKIVTEFVMFGYIPLKDISSTSANIHTECVPPDKSILDLLKCFGIDAALFNFHYTTPKFEEETLVHPTKSEEFFWLQQQKQDVIRCKEENKNTTTAGLSMEERINTNNELINGSEFLDPDLPYFVNELPLNKRKRKLLSEAQIKVEMDDYVYAEEDMEGIAETQDGDDDPNYEVTLPKRKRKKGGKAQRNSVHGNRKEFMELGSKRKKKRIGHFFTEFAREAERHQLSHASFAAYLGYRSCTGNGSDPITASSFKKLHEGGSSSDNQVELSDLKASQNGKSDTPRPAFLDLTDEQKSSCVGTFWDTFLKEAEGQGISTSSLAAYCGARSTYRTDRASATIFRQLHDSEDVKDKWSSKLWSSLRNEETNSPASTVLLPIIPGVNILARLR